MGEDTCSADNHDDAITFIQRMASVGVNLEPTERHMKQIMNGQLEYQSKFPVTINSLNSCVAVTMKRGTCYKLNEGTLPVDQIQCI